MQLWEAAQTRLVAKTHTSPRTYHQERRALRCGPSTVSSVRLPRVVDACPDTLTLLMSWLPGTAASALPSLPDSAWEAAGAWLAARHALPVSPPDPMPLAQALDRRLQALQKRARRADVPPDVLARLTPLPTQGRRALCHRDFQPDNWLWDGATLGIVDFEHSRPDDPLADLVKLEATAFIHQPTACRAFYRGYGSRPPPEVRTPWVTWHGVFTLTWGLQHRAPDRIAEGRAILQSAIPEPTCPLP